MDHPLNAFDLPADAVRERFAWAMKRGRPTWLWPDLDPQQWQRSMAVIESATRAAMTGLPVTIDDEPQSLSVACYTSGMGPLLGYWVEQGTIGATTPIAAILALQLRHNRLRMERLAQEARAITEAFARGGIACVVIKGMHTAHAYFPEPGTRAVADIDLVIAPDDEPLAGQILTGAGFEPGIRGACPPQQVWRPRHTRVEPMTLSFVHVDDPWAVDLQTSLNRRYSAGAPVVQLDSAIAVASEPWAIMPSSRVLRQPVMLLQLAVHTAFNSFNILRLVELALVAQADFQKDPALWDRFVDAAERSGALGMIYPALRLCDQLVPGAIALHVLAASERQVPARVHKVMDQLRPANAQALLRFSARERLMWAGSFKDRLGQLTREVLLPPPHLNGEKRRRIYYNRLRRIVAGALAR